MLDQRTLRMLTFFTGREIESNLFVVLVINCCAVYFMCFEWGFFLF